MITPNIILRDVESTRENLLPLTFTRPVSQLRVGILTIREKWERMLPGIYGCETASYLAPKYGVFRPQEDSTTYIIDSALLPSTELVEAITKLKPGEFLSGGNGETLCQCIDHHTDNAADEIEYTGTVERIDQLYDIFLLNSNGIKNDFHLLTNGRESAPLDSSNTIIGDPKLVFAEDGATAHCATFNTTSGPIYLGKNCEVMEGTHIRGGFAMLDHAVVNMGTKIYGATTLGPYCKVGGELNNVVMIGFSNKAHDGFLGNAVIGEWCNIGAGSNASNLKNDYTEIKLWNYSARRFLKTGLQFCGLIMGDHSKAGINTMFNTATVFGVAVNFHGSGYPRNFTASFQDGSSAGMNDLPLSKFFATAERVMARRGIAMSETDREIYTTIHEITSQFKG